MSRVNDYTNNIKAAFAIYDETLCAILHTNLQKMEPDVFRKLIELNLRHLFDNLDKALVLFKDKVEDSK